MLRLIEKLSLPVEDLRNSVTTGVNLGTEVVVRIVKIPIRTSNSRSRTRGQEAPVGTPEGCRRRDQRAAGVLGRGAFIGTRPKPVVQIVDDNFVPDWESLVPAVVVISRIKSSTIVVLSN